MGLVRSGFVLYARTMFEVKARIQSTMSPDAVPVDIPYYRGDDVASALHGVTSVMAHLHSEPQYTRVLSVTIDITEESS